MQILKNGIDWLDTNGNPIHCHGGHIVKFADTYYWYGEDRRGNAYVSCYASKDLMNWEFRGDILTTDSNAEDLFGYDCRLQIEDGKINLERPKIVYNEKTKKYIMWAHYANFRHYKCSGVALASSDFPDREFTYHGAFKPFGDDARDCNVFFENGKMYFVAACNKNQDLHIYEMDETYTGVKKLVQKAFMGESREAPAFFHLNGKTYLLTSWCSGWRPNQGKFAFADNIECSWSTLFDFGDDTTYHSQPTSVLCLEINGKTQYIYIGDRWGGNQWDGKDMEYFKYVNSTYYFSLIKTNADGSIELLPCDEFTIDLNDDGFRIVKS